MSIPPIGRSTAAQPFPEPPAASSATSSSSQADLTQLVHDFTATFFTSQAFFDDLLYAEPVATLDHVYEVLASRGIPQSLARSCLEHLAASHAAASSARASDVSAGPVIHLDGKMVKTLYPPAQIAEVLQSKFKGFSLPLPSTWPSDWKGDPQRVLEQVSCVVCRVAERGGYYTAGHVQFVNHFSTYPNRDPEVWGACLVQNAYALYRRWSQSASADAKFVIGEAGAGQGDQAEGFLKAVEILAGQDPSSALPSGQDFYQRVVYNICEISPELQKRQTERLRRFIADGKLNIRTGDVRQLNQVVQGEQVSEIYIPLNEVIDNLSFGKFRRTAQGISVALIIPMISPAAKSQIDTHLWGQLQNSSDLLRKKFSRVISESSPSQDVEHQLAADHILLSRSDLERLELYSDDLVKTAEVFLPIAYFPKLAHFFAAYPCYEALFEGEEFWVSPEQEEIFAGLSHHLHDKNIQVDVIDYGGTMVEIQEQPGLHEARCYPDLDRDPLSRKGRADITIDVNFTLLSLMAQKYGFQVAGYSPQSSLCDPSDPLLECEDLWIRSGVVRETLEDTTGGFKRVVFTRGTIVPQANALCEPLDRPDLTGEGFEMRTRLGTTTLWPASNRQDREITRLIGGFVIRELRLGHVDFASPQQRRKREEDIGYLLSAYYKNDAPEFLALWEHLDKNLPILLSLVKGHQALTDVAFAEMFAQFQKDAIPKVRLMGEKLWRFADLFKNVLLFYFQHRKEIESRM